MSNYQCPAGDHIYLLICIAGLLRRYIIRIWVSASKLTSLLAFFIFTICFFFKVSIVRSWIVLLLISQFSYHRGTFTWISIVASILYRPLLLRCLLFSQLIEFTHPLFVFLISQFITICYSSSTMVSSSMYNRHPRIQMTCLQTCPQQTPSLLEFWHREPLYFQLFFPSFQISLCACSISEFSKAPE